TWLAPQQVAILPIADRHLEFCTRLEAELRNELVRVKTDSSHEGIGHKIRQAQLAKIPYMLVIGDKEVESGQVAIRSRNRGDLGTAAFDVFRAQLLREIQSYGKQIVEVPQETPA